MISEAEKEERREAIASVIGTHRAEGLDTDETTLKMMHQYAAGDFTLAQFSAAMRAHADAALEESGHLVRAA